jgi:hypothetical protein
MNILSTVVVLLLAVAVHAQTDGRSLGNELSGLDFKNIIGGPLLAVIDAQAQAAVTTVEFIDNFGFYKDDNGVKILQTVEFQYVQASNGSLNNFTMSVPFLTMLPIPHLQFDKVTLDFNVKLNGVSTRENSLSTDVKADLSVKQGWISGRAQFNVAVQVQSQSKTTGKVSREYSLAVHVEASQAPLPRGTQRILDLLESIVREGVSK